MWLHRHQKPISHWTNMKSNLLISTLKNENEIFHTWEGWFPKMSWLRLLLGAIHLPIPAIGESPVLVTLHGDQGVVPRFRMGTDTRHHRHVEVSGDSLIRAGETRVEGKLFRPGRQFFRGQRCAGLGIFFCGMVRAGLLLQVHVVRMR